MKRPIRRDEGLFPDEKDKKQSISDMLSKMGMKGSMNAGTGADSDTPDELNSGDVETPSRYDNNDSEASYSRAEQLRQRTWPLGKDQDLSNIKANPYLHVNDINLPQGDKKRQLIDLLTGNSQ